jgi:hypothetical protein
LFSKLERPVVTPQAFFGFSGFVCEAELPNKESYKTDILTDFNFFLANEIFFLLKYQDALTVIGNIGSEIWKNPINQEVIAVIIG